MYKKMISIFLGLTLLAAIPAQAAPKVSAGPSVSQGPRRQVATIIFSGLAGAVLGLSTLSFYGRPQDKLPNIGVGFAVGVIAGVSYTTYKAATQPREYYGAIDVPEAVVHPRVAANSHPPSPMLNFQWTF